MKKRTGFTIIETSLAMIFVAVLLITVAMIIMQMTSLYQKTIAIKTVNTTGQEIVDEISRTAGESSIINRKNMCNNLGNQEYYNQCVKDSAYNFVYHQFYSNDIYIGNRRTDEAVPTSGVFCTGKYSYIWNTGYVLKDNRASNYRAKVTYNVPGRGSTTISDFRLLRTIDIGGKVCASNLNGNTYSITKAANNVTYTLSTAEAPRELLDEAEKQLAIYDMKVFRPARHSASGHAYYSGTFTLATLTGDIDITASGNYCTSPPSGIVSDFSYCAINKFNFAVQATGEE
ncbi:hypothetical protein IKE84_02735 [Candidatus Saccharibacteria bacterium]|nr:hypothetical protein [Candidatus Saccharibacteria bacterium]